MEFVSADDLKSNVQGYERTEGKTVVKTGSKFPVELPMAYPII